jgi:hypothetical protein
LSSFLRSVYERFCWLRETERSERDREERDRETEREGRERGERQRERGERDRERATDRERHSFEVILV